MKKLVERLRLVENARLYRAGVLGYLETCVRLELIPTPRAALRAGRTYLAAERERERRVASTQRNDLHLRHRHPEHQPPGRLLENWTAIR